MISKPEHHKPTVLALVGPSGTGKTTLLCAVLPRLRAAGLRVGVVKHSHHDFEVDREGKDSFRLRKAGAEQMLLVAKGGWALMSDARESTSDLEEAIGRFAEDLDLILVEGYRSAECPKLELIRLPSTEPPLYSRDPNVVAVATDKPVPEPTQRPVLPMSDAATVADFIIGLVESRDGGALRPPSRSEVESVASPS